MAQERWSELDQLLTSLPADPGAQLEADVLRARAYLKRREFSAARQVLEATITRAPQAVRPRVILGHVLLQEDQDRDAAERALRDVLALDPGQVETRHNLSVLMQRQGKKTAERNGS